MTPKLDIDDDMKVLYKTLHLKSIKFSDGDSIHRLISGCLALEDFVMDLPELPTNISKLNIHSLSLKRLALHFLNMLNDFPTDFSYTFEYHGVLAKAYCLSSMNSLEKAVVEVYELGHQPSYAVNFESGAIATISNLLRGISNVKSLNLTLYFPEALIRMPPEPVLGFHKLVELKIYNENPVLQGTWVIQFLRCAPNLQTLHLDLEVPHDKFEPLPLPEKAPLCLLFHLKEIKIVYFDGNEHMLEMISYFLNHASVLEALIIGIEKEEELSSVKKLLGLPSKKCGVVTFNDV